MLVWIGFLLFILVLLALDLGVFHRRAHVISVREALTWTVIWILTALAFSGFVYLGYEHHWLGLGLQPDPVERSALHPDGEVNDARSALLKFLTGYVVELSLSADNVFVIAMLFSSFGIPRMYQHRVLFWGILGALAMRGAMIAIGARLVAEFSWVLPALWRRAHPDGREDGVHGRRARRSGKERPGPADSAIPAGDDPVRRRTLLRENAARRDRRRACSRGKRDARAGRQEVRRRGWMLTPLAPALVMVETTDLVFAVDSIPAIFAITADPFLVFTSNVFAILGLRSLYFALAGALHAFHYMKHALAVVLLTVGVKMLAHSWLHRVLGPDFNLLLLAAVLAILGIGVLVSIVEIRWGRADQPGDCRRRAHVLALGRSRSHGLGDPPGGPPIGFGEVHLACETAPGSTCGEARPGRRATDPWLGQPVPSLRSPPAHLRGSPSPGRGGAGTWHTCELFAVGPSNTSKQIVQTQWRWRPSNVPTPVRRRVCDAGWRRSGQDLGYAIRSFRRSPAFVLVALLSLTLGIGATSAIFSVIYGVLIAPYPYARPGEIWAPEVRALDGRGGHTLRARRASVR